MGATVDDWDWREDEMIAIAAALPNVRAFGRESLATRRQVSVDASKQSHALLEQTQAVYRARSLQQGNRPRPSYSQSRSALEPYSASSGSSKPMN